MTKKAMILGVSGKIGARLAGSLIDDGWSVAGAARFSDPKKEAALKQRGVSTFPYDVTRDDPASLPPADTVFLEIWDPSLPEMIWPINFYGVGKVVERYAGEADFVNGCTINVYGEGPEPADESAPCRPSNDYGRSRYAQERLIDFFCHRSTSKAIHVRYAHANSPESGIIRRFAEAILAGKSLGRDPDALVQVIGIEDFVRVTAGAIRCLANPPAVVNCCHPHIWTKRELADAIAEKLGRGKAVFDVETGGREHSACARADRMVEWFGEPRVPVETLIERTVSALR